MECPSFCGRTGTEINLIVDTYMDTFNLILDYEHRTPSEIQSHAVQ